MKMKRKKYVAIAHVFIAMLWLLNACSEPPQLPKGIVSQQRMVAILTDFHIVEGYNTSLEITDTLLRTQLIEKYKQVFKKHQIDSLTFVKNLKYYNTHSSELEKIYQQVSTRLDILKKQLETTHKP